MSKIKKIIQNLYKSFTVTGLPVIFGLLGGIGGQGDKWTKTFVLPFIFFICVLIELKSLWAIWTLSLIGCMFCGYGEKSFLRKLFKQNNILTRGSIGILISLAFIEVPILKGTWIIYLLGSLGIILTWALISHRGFGEFKVKFFGKEYNVLKVDFLSYSILGICGNLIIFRG